MRKTYGKSYVEVRRYVLTTSTGLDVIGNMLRDMGKDSKKAAYRIMKNDDLQYLATFECDIFEYDLIQRKLAENNCPCEKVERVCF